MPQAEFECPMPGSSVGTDFSAEGDYDPNRTILIPFAKDTAKPKEMVTLTIASKVRCKIYDSTGTFIAQADGDIVSVSGTYTWRVNFSISPGYRPNCRIDLYVDPTSPSADGTFQESDANITIGSFGGGGNPPPPIPGGTITFTDTIP